VTDLFCRTFLFAFLFFYSTMVLVLLAGIIRRMLRGQLKGNRRVRAPDRIREFALFPKTQRY
jgi:hypothetical protein